MAEGHITRELILAVVREERPLGDLVEQMGYHLAELCPICRAGGPAYLEEKEARGLPAADYEEAYERARARSLSAAERMPQERERAAETLEALLALPAHQRLQAVRRQPERFHGTTLAGLLLEKTRSCLPGYPREAHAFARLAGAVLHPAPVTPYAVQLYSLAIAHQGNARRVEGELAEAEQFLETARFLFETAGDGDPLAVAELDHLEGSLRRAQRRLPQAVSLLVAAEAAYREHGDPVQAARVLLNLGMVHREADDLEGALLVTRQALRALPLDQEPRLHFNALHNLAFLLHSLGEHEEARRVVEGAQALLHRHGDPLTRLRLLWVEGQIARGLGESDEAEGALRAVRQEFFRHGLPYDAALVTLDLASLLAEAGRTSEVQALAEELVPLFESRGIHREASAALLFFVQAARAERLTLSFLQELISYLQAARGNPNLPFQKPS